MKALIAAFLLLFSFLPTHAQLLFGRNVLDPDDNRLSTALVICPYTTDVYPQIIDVVNMGRISLHHINPYIGVDIYLDKAYRDIFKKKHANTYSLIDNKLRKFETNASINVFARGGKNTSIFNTDSRYDSRTDTWYDYYATGTGDAIVFGQMRFGYTKLDFTFESYVLDSTPTKNEYNSYDLFPQDALIATQSNFFHIGWGRSKRYHTQSLNSGIDRIGLKKIYFDIFLANTISYNFYDVTGNVQLLGYYPPQFVKHTGWRIGYEVIRLNPFSGYMKIELGIRPGVRPYLSAYDDWFLYYGTLAVGFSIGSN